MRSISQIFSPEVQGHHLLSWLPSVPVGHYLFYGAFIFSDVLSVTWPFMLFLVPWIISKLATTCQKMPNILLKHWVYEHTCSYFLISRISILLTYFSRSIHFINNKLEVLFWQCINVKPHIFIKHYEIVWETQVMQSVISIRLVVHCVLVFHYLNHLLVNNLNILLIDTFW